MGKARQIFKPIFGLSDKIGLLVLFEAVQAWSKREMIQEAEIWSVRFRIVLKSKIELESIRLKYR